MLNIFAIIVYMELLHLEDFLKLVFFFTILWFTNPFPGIIS